MSSGAEARRPLPRPALFILLVLVCEAILFALGTWQILRRADQHALTAAIAQRQAAPPLALGTTVDAAAVEHRRARITGRFRHDRELYLSGRGYRGRAGVHVVTPLIRKGLPPVLVDRGWVPMEAKDQNKRAAGDVQGRVTVTGTVQVPRRRGLFTPENDPAAGFWIVADPASMALAAGIAAPLAVIVAADHPTGRGPWPVPRGGPPSISDNHMIYALTWYSLALILAVIAIIRLASNHDRHSSL